MEPLDSTEGDLRGPEKMELVLESTERETGNQCSAVAGSPYGEALHGNEMGHTGFSTEATAAFRGIPVPHSLFALILRRGDAKILSFRPYLDTFRVAAKSVKTMTCVLMVWSSD